MVNQLCAKADTVFVTGFQLEVLGKRSQGRRKQRWLGLLRRFQHGRQPLSQAFPRNGLTKRIPSPTEPDRVGQRTLKIRRSTGLFGTAFRGSLREDWCQMGATWWRRFSWREESDGWNFADNDLLLMASEEQVAGCSTRDWLSMLTCSQILDEQRNSERRQVFFPVDKALPRTVANFIRMKF